MIQTRYSGNAITAVTTDRKNSQVPRHLHRLRDFTPARGLGQAFTQDRIRHVVKVDQTPKQGQDRREKETEGELILPLHRTARLRDLIHVLDLAQDECIGLTHARDLNHSQGLLDPLMKDLVRGLFRRRPYAD